MKWFAFAMIAVHVLAKTLSIFGLTFAVSHTQTFASDRMWVAFYAWAINNVGTIDIWSGALAALAFGAATIGWRRTLVFAVCAVTISAAAELTGTKTGWPFGGYSYTTFLGAKIAGRVPYTVPMSWFYMGFVSYLLALAIVQRRATPSPPVLAVLLGAWLLMAWDLTLDPAMASPNLTYMHFWVWHEHGPYFGMPLRNLAGWLGTGIAFIGVSRVVWRSDPPIDARDARFPFVLYAANVAWAMALSLSVGLWPTAIAALAFSLFPAAAALRTRRRSPQRLAA